MFDEFMYYVSNNSPKPSYKSPRSPPLPRPSTTPPPPPPLM